MESLSDPQANQLAVYLIDRIPGGCALQIRRDDQARVTLYRYTRLVDGLVAQQLVSDVLVTYAISVEGLADGILAYVRKALQEPTHQQALL